jgi:hypothetical protein
MSIIGKVPTGRRWPARISPPAPVRGQGQVENAAEPAKTRASCRIHERSEAQCPSTPAVTGAWRG